MPREMFGDVVDPSVKVGTKQWYTVPLSILAHTSWLLGALIVIPLLATDMLPTPQSVMAFVAVPPPPPPPPPRRHRRRRRAAAAAAVEIDVNPNAAPVEAPKEIKPEPPPPRSELSSGRRCRRRHPGGRRRRRASRRRRRRRRRGAGPRRRRHQGPEDPQERRARSIRRSPRPPRSRASSSSRRRSEGRRVKDAKVLRSVPMLDQAALDAVSSGDTRRRCSTASRWRSS